MKDHMQSLYLKFHHWVSAPSVYIAVMLPTESIFYTFKRKFLSCLSSAVKFYANFHCLLHNQDMQLMLLYLT